MPDKEEENKDPQSFLEIEKAFATRIKLNHELLFYLTENSDFKDKLAALRKKYRIPSTENKENTSARNPITSASESITDDAGNESFFTVSEQTEEENLYPEEDLDGRDKSVHLGELSDKEQSSFNADINAILASYKLPKNFYDWVQYYVLYNKQPPWGWEVSFNLELLQQIESDNLEAMRIGLTSEEKKYIRGQYRKLFGMKEGRPPKWLKENYEQLNNLLKKSKNTQREFRSLGVAKKILLEKKKKISFFENDKEKTEKMKYADIAGELFGLEDMEKEKQQIQNLRKTVERLKKRHNAEIKKPKK